MSEKSYIAKSDFMLKMIANIYAVVDRHGGIVAALDDEIEGRPAVLMAFLQIGETLNRLDALVLRECGLERDAKGSYDVRNFIAHDYLGVGYRDWETDRKSTRLNSSHSGESRMPSSA